MRTKSEKNPTPCFFPDYRDIEIKCCQRFSNYPLNLFSKALDGPYLFSTNEFLQKYGELNEKYGKKELIIDLSCKRFSIKGPFMHKLVIDRDEKKIYIETIDMITKNKTKEFYVNFESVESVLTLKLNTLAFVKASMRKINNIRHYRYYSLNIYKIKSFDTFIDLLEKDFINCTFICRVSKTNFMEGKNKNKGMHFTIDKDKMDLLFETICYCNSDEKKLIRYD